MICVLTCELEAAVHKRIQTMDLCEQLVVLAFQAQLLAGQELVLFACDAELLLQLCCRRLGALSRTPPRVHFAACVTILLLDVLALCCRDACRVAQRLQLLDELPLPRFRLGILQLESTQGRLHALQDMKLRLRRLAFPFVLARQVREPSWRLPRSRRQPIGR
jgi:hypothetical protein